MRKAVLPLMFAMVAALATSTAAKPKGGPALGKIEVVVIRESGETLAGATVTLPLEGDPELTIARTGRKGSVRFSKLAPGTYTVTAVFGFRGIPPGVFLPELFGSVDVQLGAGEMQHVVIVVRPFE